jgi:hypothetical protein
LKKYNNKFVDEVENLLKDGREKHQSILDLYEITASDSVGAGYLKNANEEKKQANFWRGFSVLFIISTVCWMLYAYSSAPTNTYAVQAPSSELQDASDTKNNNLITVNAAENVSASSNNSYYSIPWYRFFMTFSVSGILLWGSAYSAQQSTKHRNNEKRNRWLSLEIKAMDPFIHSLPKEHQIEIKRQLTEKIFGRDSNDNVEPKVIDEHILKIVSDAIGNVISKLPK